MLPTLVLLPGMDGTGELFAPLVSELGSEIRTLVMRYPPRAFLDYPALTELVRSQLPTDEPFVLLAESFSGPIAISLAAARPDNLVGLILCASFVRNPRPLLSLVLRGIVSTEKLRVPNWIMTSVMLNGFPDEALARLITQAVASVDPSVLSARFQAILSLHITEQLDQIHVPSLYLRGSKDLLVPKQAAQLIVSKRKNWHLIELAAPHLMSQAMPKEVAKIVESFVADLDLGCGSSVRFNGTRET